MQRRSFMAAMLAAAAAPAFARSESLMKLWVPPAALVQAPPYRLVPKGLDWSFETWVRGSDGRVVPMGLDSRAGVQAFRFDGRSRFNKTAEFTNSDPAFNNGIALEAANAKVGGITYLGELGKAALYQAVSDAAVMWYPGVPTFAGDPVTEHQPDECIDLERLVQNAQIIANAIVKLANLPLE